MSFWKLPPAVAGGSCPRQQRTDGFKGRRVLQVGVLAVASLALVVSGCSRKFWREQADFDGYNILQENQTNALWQVPRLDVQPHPLSRFYDPYDPDCAPLPPDDPTAHVSMHCVDNGISGYRSWHKFGDALSIENPHWLSPFGLTPEQTVAAGNNPELLPELKDVTLPDAIELAHIHSRDYQFQIEQTYLSALQLSFERFRLGVRFLGIGGGEPTFNPFFTGRPGRNSDLLLPTRFGMSQLLPTGGQIAVDLANNTLFTFGPDGFTTSATTLSYALVQPLARGAGRKIVLEDLTQAERDVLYSVRDLARFRQVFFVDLVGSYLGLLEQRQILRNQLDNIRRLEEQVATLRALSAQRPEQTGVPLDELPPDLAIPEQLQERLIFNPEARTLYWIGPMTEAEQELLLGLSEEPRFRAAASDLVQLLTTEVTTLDVAQLQTQLASSRNNYRQGVQNLQTSLDQYKIVLGLPPEMPMTIDEAMLTQFELIAPELMQVEQAAKEFVEVWAALDPIDPDAADLRQVVRDLRELQLLIRAEGLDVVAEDLARIRALLNASGDADPNIRQFADEAERERVLRDFQNDQRLYSGTRARFEGVESSIDEMLDTAGRDDLTPEERRGLYLEIAGLREDLLRITRNLAVIQVGLRTDLIALQEFEMSSEDAIRTALENRVDLMNARAEVMDARRQVEIAANLLESVLDVVASGNVRTQPGNRPLSFSSQQSDFGVGLRFTAPLDQMAERNTYRATLINYQRARRAYMEFEDRAKLQIRTSSRQLSVLRENFETSRQQIRLAALQYDSAVELAAAPVQQGQGGGRNQGLNLLQALNSILTAQNQLVRNWIDYEQNRLNIHRDMGTMEIDPSGIWVDRFYQQLSSPSPTDVDIESPAPGPGVVPPGPLPPDGPPAAGGPFPGEILEAAASEVAPWAADADRAGAGRAGDDLLPQPPRELRGQADLSEPDDGPGRARPFPDHGDGAGPVGQHAELGPVEQGRGDDDDHLDRP